MWYDGDSKYCCRVIEREFDKTVFMTEKDYEDFEKFTKFWTFIESHLKKGNVKVKIFDCITGKYRGLAHQDCNLNLTITNNISLVFNNLQNFHSWQIYDSHLLFQEVGKYHFKIKMIPKTIENISALLSNKLKKMSLIMDFQYYL